MAETNYIVKMERILGELQALMDSLSEDVRECMEYGDVSGAFAALRKYREFSIRFVNADCDLTLVKLTERVCKDMPNHIP
jgi:hypothetical protein